MRGLAGIKATTVQSVQTCCCVTLLYTRCVKRPHLKWLHVQLHANNAVNECCKLRCANASPCYAFAQKVLEYNSRENKLLNFTLKLAEVISYRLCT